MASDVPPIDLSSLTPSEFETKLGELVRTSLLRDGACVLLSKGVREFTILPPRILEEVPDDTMADVLLNAWSDEEILEFLAQRERRRNQRKST